VTNPDANAQLLAESVAAQLLKRASFRRAMRRAVEAAMHAGAQGVKITCGGRLGGSEMGRRERYVFGKLPLHNLDADIEYGFAEARTTYGTIGVKVWLYKGPIKKESDRAADAKAG
jgi:small subunit ribosomal protein S3